MRVEYRLEGSLQTSKLSRATIMKGIEQALFAMETYFVLDFVNTGRGLRIGTYHNPGYENTMWYWPQHNAIGIGVHVGGNVDTVRGTILHELMHWAGTRDHPRGDWYQYGNRGGRNITAADARRWNKLGLQIRMPWTPESIEADPRPPWVEPTPLVVRDDRYSLARATWHKLDVLANDEGDEMKIRWARDRRRNQGPSKVRLIDGVINYFPGISVGKTDRLFYGVCDANGCPRRFTPERIGVVTVTVLPSDPNDG